MNNCVYIVLTCFLFFLECEIVSADGEVTATARLVSHQTCDTDLDCKENSFCFGNDNGVKGSCKCREPYLMNKNRTYYECLLAASLGDSCIRDVQCLLQAGSASFCSGKYVCQCQYNAHVAMDNKCYFSKYLGEICLTRNECRLGDGTFAYCDLGRCVCPPEYHPAADRLHCIPSVPLGQSCDSDENCFHTNAVCEGVCKCSANHVESREGLECLEVAQNFGDTCLEDVQCSRHLKESICTTDQVCGCRSDYHEYISSEKTGCYRNTSIGEACDLKEECVLSPVMQDSVDCISGICTCTYAVSSNEFGCEIVSSARTVFAKVSLILVFLPFLLKTDFLLR